MRELERENHILYYKYVPHKGDDIDEALANFANEHPEGHKMKILFLRESEGVYRFGQKRVYVRVDQGNVNIRVGGGFMGIENFIKEYTSGEIEKLERKNVINHFQERV